MRQGRFRKNLPMVWESRTRGHSFGIRDKPFRTQVRRNLFSQRVVNAWNSLPPNVVKANAFRIVRGDHIENYKIQTGIDRVDSDRMLPMGVHNSLMMRENLFRTDGRRNFFSQWVVNVWNSEAYCDFKNKLV